VSKKILFPFPRTKLGPSLSKGGLFLSGQALGHGTGFLGKTSPSAKRRSLGGITCLTVFTGKSPLSSGGGKGGKNHHTCAQVVRDSRGWMKGRGGGGRGEGRSGGGRGRVGG